MYPKSKSNPCLPLFVTAILVALGLTGLVLPPAARALAGDTAPADHVNGQRTDAGNPCDPACSHKGMSGQAALRQTGWRKQKPRLDAQLYAARIKRRLERRFAERRQQFRRHQVLVERQRRAARRSKARIKARQFAAARRHAAKHAARHRAMAGAKRKSPGYRKPGHLAPSEALAKPGGKPVHWQPLWRRSSHTASP